MVKEEKMLQWFAQQNTFTIFLIAGVIVGFITFLDIATGVELSFSIFYFLPIVMVSWYIGLRAGITVAVLCAFTWILADYYGEHRYSADYFYLFNGGVRLGIFLTIAWLIAKLKHNSEELTKQRLLAQRSFDVISTSQHIIALIARNITVHNAALWSWQAEQKAQGRNVPRIVTDVSKKISENLAALSEVVFSFQPQHSGLLDTKEMLRSVEQRLEELQGDEEDNRDD